MGWKIVEIESEDMIKLYLNNLLINRANGKIIIPIADIDVLIIANYKIMMSVQLLNALASENVAITFMNQKHKPVSHLINIVGNYRSFKVFNEQITWSDYFKGDLWQKIITNKITNQLSLLKLNNVDYDRLNLIEEQLDKVKHYDVTNREGHVAKVYWNTIFGNCFVRDQDARQNPLLNIKLNYGYTVLRSMVIRSIIKKGLDTRVSIFHKSQSNYFALADDIIEPFRPIVDKIVCDTQDETVFTVLTREKIIQALNGKVTINGSKQYITNAIDIILDEIIANKKWKEVYLWE